MDGNEEEPVTDFNLANKVSSEQLAAEEKLMRQNRMLYSRIFNAHMDKLNKQLEEIEPRLKYMSPSEIIQEDNIKRATCPLCGILCQTEIHMLQHKDMLRCRKQQAKNKGKVYVPENKQPVHCDICDKTVQRCKWDGHVLTKAHKLNVIITDGRAFNCPICDKNFTKNKDPKRSLRKHLCRKIHLKKLSHPRNRASHDALIKLYGFKINTTKLLKSICVCKCSSLPPRAKSMSRDPG